MDERLHQKVETREQLQGYEALSVSPAPFRIPRPSVPTLSWAYWLCHRRRLRNQVSLGRRQELAFDWDRWVATFARTRALECRVRKQELVLGELGVFLAGNS